MTRPAVLILVFAAACGTPRAEHRGLADLSTSLDAVRADFNAHASEPRFITLLSAT